MTRASRRSTQEARSRSVKVADGRDNTFVRTLPPIRPCGNRQHTMAPALSTT